MWRFGYGLLVDIMIHGRRNFHGQLLWLCMAAGNGLDMVGIHRMSLSLQRLAVAYLLTSSGLVDNVED